MEELKKLYEGCLNDGVKSVEKLSASGSNRVYYRLKGENGGGAIGVVGTSIEENVAFVTIARHFRAKGLPVPEVYCVGDDGLRYVQEDVGDVILFDAIAEGRQSGEFSDAEVAMLKAAIECLPAIQYRGGEGLDFSVCYPQREFDERMIAFDLNYFKYCFLKATGLDFSETRLQDDFERMAEVLMGEMTDTFMYRDFQSRNVMLRDGKPCFIDFQGGRKGPIYYDVASFVWQAKANFSQAMKEELVGYYLEALREYDDVDEGVFRSKLRHFVLFRTLQVLGAYGYRGYFERKAHFLQSIPFAIANLEDLLKEGFEEYPYLMEVLRELVQLSHLREDEKKKKLQVKVWSFAYKNGLPYDNSGNGGGYVFDCRAIHNPGRYEPYKKLTGMDKEVIDFLEEDGEVFGFLNNVYGLVDSHVERYIERGFSSVMVCFGCTGGQHRSVYCAESVARRLVEKYDVEVELVHREQRVKEVMKDTAVDFAKGIVSQVVGGIVGSEVGEGVASVVGDAIGGAAEEIAGGIAEKGVEKGIDKAAKKIYKKG